MYARIYHRYTHLIPALGIVREPTVWSFITSQYPGIHDMSLPSQGRHRRQTIACCRNRSDAGLDLFVHKYYLEYVLRAIPPVYLMCHRDF